jgi:hypothetical protein
VEAVADRPHPRRHTAPPQPTFTAPWAFVEEVRPVVVAGSVAQQRTFRRHETDPARDTATITVSVLADPDRCSPLLTSVLGGADPDVFSPAAPFVADVRAPDGATHVGYWFDGHHLVVVHGTGVSADDVAAVLVSIG